MSDLTFDVLPYELIAAIADWVHKFQDIAHMSKSCRSLNYGVKLSRRGRIITTTYGAFGHPHVVRDYLFIATGTGIGPVKSMIHYLLDSSIDRPVTLWWGLRGERDIYFQEELEAMAANDQRFTYNMTLSQPSEVWEGRTGYVSKLVDERITSVKGLDVYLCGGDAMITDVKAVLKTKGLCPVHTEKFY